MTRNKLPPYSVASEKLVIGSLLREPQLLSDIREVLPDADVFFRPDYGALYRAIRDACAERPDAGTDDLLETLGKTGPFKGDDAAETLRDLAEAGQPAAGALLHANVVAEKARRRRLIAVVSDVIHEAYYSEEPAEVIAQRAGERLSSLLKSPEDRTGP